MENGGFSVEGEGHKYPPWGFDGGSDGKTAAMEFRQADGTVRALPSKLPNLPARVGDRVVVVGPCAGGYGAAFEREPARVRDDVLDGHITVEQARAQYGVVIDEAVGVDDSATAALRVAQGAEA